MRLYFSNGRRVGVLGGSFNPAHAGHLHISDLALKRLRLDQIVWLVSPQNPLKEETGMAPFATRFAGARAIVKQHPRIAVSDFEQRIHTRYTADTLTQLTSRFRGVRFVWIMGADNLIQFDRWQRWRDIAAMVPFAVLARPGYMIDSAGAKAAQALRRYHLSEGDAAVLAASAPPAWVLLHSPMNPLSSTAIRAGADCD